MKCDYCGFSAFGKYKCTSCGAPHVKTEAPAVHPAMNAFGDNQAYAQMQMATGLYSQQMGNMLTGNPFLGGRIFG